MSAVVWTSARAAVRVHRTGLAGSALVVALSAALLTATGAWLEVGLRHAETPDRTGSLLVAVASSFAGTAVVIAVLVVASTIAAALRPRARELALLRAVGATVGQLRRFVAAEVLLVFAVAAPVGVAAGLVLAPLLAGPLRGSGVVPAGLTPGLSPWPALGAVALLLPAALVAARLAARESARLDPAGAVRRSAAEPVGLPRARAVTAAALAVCGLLTAASPFAVAGTLGGATATLGAVLLVVALALAGPVLVGEVARRGLAAAPAGTGALPRLALANARGFSRRMTGAIVPLALLLALGTVQTGTSSAVARAAEAQAREGIAADLVAEPRDGGTLTPAQVAAAAALPGVASAAATAVVPAEVRIDQDGGDLPVLGALSWEASTLRTVPAGGYLDPDVVAGSLGALAGARTIAVSRDAAFGSASLGDPVDVRVGDSQVRYRIVAVYARGLGLGDYLVGAGAADRPTASGAASTLLVRVDGDGARARRELAGAGLRVLDVPAYAREVRDASSRQQELSTVLLLALLALVAVLAANTLVTATASRRAELSLLGRTGATCRQLLTLVLLESSLVTGIAVVAGLACSLPALLGVGQGLLGVPLPVVDGTVVGALVAAVVVIGVAVPVAAAVPVTSRGRR
jgi:putative ABC transport system permease protein